LAADSIPIVLGPTGAGKTGLALWLADRLPLTVISADSRQIYRGFDIGTAKPSAVARARVPHEGIDVCDPTERYSSARWATEARQSIATASAQVRVPVVVGGTGFYIRALTAPLFDEPPMDPVSRAALARELNDVSTPDLRERCRIADPARAHLGRAQLLRAIEVASITGRPLSEWHRDAPSAVALRPRYLVVDPGVAALATAIGARARWMLDEGGWAAEVAELDRHVAHDAPAWNATGYAAIRALGRGELSRDAALTRVITGTRQYAKRQRTWFRHQLGDGPVTVLDPAARGCHDAAARWLTEEESAA